MHPSRLPPLSRCLSRLHLCSACWGEAADYSSSSSSSSSLGSHLLLPPSSFSHASLLPVSCIPPVEKGRLNSSQLVAGRLGRAGTWEEASFQERAAGRRAREDAADWGGGAWRMMGREGRERGQVGGSVGAVPWRQQQQWLGSRGMSSQSGGKEAMLLRWDGREEAESREGAALEGEMMQRREEVGGGREGVRGAEELQVVVGSVGVEDGEWADQGEREEGRREREGEDGSHAFAADWLQSRQQRRWRREMNSKLTDLTQPHEWYPLARSKQRHVIIHVGPTNSGKTHAALSRLQEAKSGVYCGPLRLLAWEVAERLNRGGVKCSLVTGQERRAVEGAEHTAMTVEMADVASEREVGVIDEIQMMSCPSRGASFTRALLGLPVAELHLCGDPAAADLIHNLLLPTSDTVELRSYSRLSPLTPLSSPLRCLSKVTRGDAVVAFSRRDIFAIKEQIESLTHQSCCVVYGSLPPETRSTQADLFNQQRSGFDVLVASDAIGMGLNLNIKRVVFSSLEKFDGVQRRRLSAAEIKQIAGRAGRFSSHFPNGSVTCLNAADLHHLHAALATPPSTINAAGLFPSFDLLSLYSSLHPDKSLPRLLEAFVTSARLSPHYFISDCTNIQSIAEVLEPLPLSLADHFSFALSPVDAEDSPTLAALLHFATAYCQHGEVQPPIHPLLSLAAARVPQTPKALSELEAAHKVLDLYLWLSLRFRCSFRGRQVVMEQRRLCTMLIDHGLRILTKNKNMKSDDAWGPFIKRKQKKLT